MTDRILQEVGHIVRHELERRNKGPVTIERESGIGRRTVSKIMNGGSTNSGTLLALLTFLEIPIGFTFWQAEQIVEATQEKHTL